MVVPSNVLGKSLLKAANASHGTQDVPDTWLWCSRGFTIGAHLNARNPQMTRQYRTFCEEKSTQHRHAGERGRHEEVSLENAHAILEKLGEKASKRLMLFPDLPGVHPCSVNLLNVNGLVVVPRQHAYRVSPVAAVDILHEAFQGIAKHGPCVKLLAKKDIAREVSTLAERYPTLPFYLRPGESMTWEDAAKTCTLAKDRTDPSVREVLDALKVPPGERGNTIVGPRVLQIPAQGTVDILEAFIFVSLRTLELDCAFVDTSHLCQYGGNLHCATNRLPNLDALGWDVDDLGAELLG